MAAKYPKKIIQLGDVVITQEILKAMLMKIEDKDKDKDKDKKVSKEYARTKKAWAVRVTEAERVALAAVLAAMRTNVKSA